MLNVIFNKTFKIKKKKFTNGFRFADPEQSYMVDQTYAVYKITTKAQICFQIQISSNLSKYWKSSVNHIFASVVM